MNTLEGAADAIVGAQQASGKPLAVIVAGHNGSGKSTMWHLRLSPLLEIPLINADRMMLSILPEVRVAAPLPAWAQQLRDSNVSWMEVGQKGVEGFTAQAMARHLPFATETVFSHWHKKPDGTFESKIDKIIELQQAGYFVLLLFVGLANAGVSIGRVQARVQDGGHNVPIDKLIERFPRTQKAIAAAAPLADATILMDNSREWDKAFTTCQVLHGGQSLYDRRDSKRSTPAVILAWLDVVSPRA